MNKIKLGRFMDNTYTLRLINEETGQMRKAYAHNVVTNSAITSMLTSVNGTEVKGIACGSGTGEPSPTDTHLFKKLWFYGNNSSYEKSLMPVISITEKDNYTIFRLKTTVPANSTYVGTITEIGLASGNSSDNYLLTHALVKDAEGHPISIVKTDIDKLVIEIEIKVLSSYDANTGFELWGYNECLLQRYAYENYGHLEFGDNQCYNWGLMNYAYKGQTYYGAYSGESGSFDSNKRTYTVNNGRIGTDSAFKNHYVNNIHISGVGVFRLPNANVMPNVNITGVSVGTGDGHTTEFKTPINLFIKDTDKIYIDGVLKVRDVDYTIDNKANLDMLHEITPGSFLENISGGKVISKNKFSQISCMPFVPLLDIRGGGRPSGTLYGSSRDNYTYIDCASYALAADHPLIIELREDPTIGLDVNACKFRYFYIQSKNGTTRVPNLALVLEYSMDGSVFTEVARANLTDHSYNSVYDFTFDTVKAKYWRLSLDFNNCSEEYKAKKDDYYLTFWDGNHNNRNTGDVQMSMLYYKGSPLKFINPPADGAVITMDCTLDRPFKTPNWVIDFSYEFQL